MADSVLTVGDLVLDTARHRARRGGRAIDLTDREARLLETLMRHAGQALWKRQILDQAWGHESGAGTNTVETYIHYLRVKIDRVGESPLIRTVRGIGYLLGE